MISCTPLKVVDKFREKRFIVHYLQPYLLYISPKFHIAGFPKPDIKRGVFLQGIRSSHIPSFFDWIIGFAGTMFARARLLNHAWQLRELLKLPPASPMDAVRRAFGNKGLRQAYRENLEIVLSHVAELCNELPGKILITSDHGELLGEGGLYSHPCGCRHPLLVEVPYFEVKKVKKVVTLRSKLRRRVKKLKERQLKKT